MKQFNIALYMSRINVQEIQVLENELINGNRQGVLRRLIGLNSSGIPRSLLWRVANLLNRADNPREAIKLLRPIVVLRKRINMLASEPEQLEYALALCLIGATQEALARFDQYVGKRDYRFHFYYGAALVTQWKYFEAIEHFKEVIRSDQAPEYQISVAKTNLAAALVFEGLYSEAQAVITELMDIVAKKNNQKLIQGYCYELLAQIEFFSGHYEKALELLKTGEGYLISAPEAYRLTNKKWQIFSRLGLSPKSVNARSELEQLRGHAILTEQWETIRECDMFLAIFERNQDLLIKVYFGTPFESYRSRILQRWGKEVKLPKYYDWAPAPNPKNEQLRLLELTTGCEGSETKSLKEQKQLYKLLNCLASDFYQPFKVQQLFSILFKGEYYDPDSSDRRVFANINRLRTWFDKRAIPIVVRRKSFGYRLFFTKAYAVRVGLRTQDTASKTVLDQIRELPNILDGVNVGEVMQKTGLSRASAQRRLAELVSSGVLIQSGSGRATRYKQS